MLLYVDWKGKYIADISVNIANVVNGYWIKTNGCCLGEAEQIEMGNVLRTTTYLDSSQNNQVTDVSIVLVILVMYLPKLDILL